MRDFLDRVLSGRVLVAGVGCVGHGDDAFGPLLVRSLRSLGWQNALDCGDRLEDFTLDIVAQAPERIVIADAVEMQARPGDLALLQLSDLAGSECHGHGASLQRVMEYLRMRTGAEVLLLAVQPDRTSRGLSPEVEATIEDLAEAFEGSAGPGSAGPGSAGILPACATC